MLNCERPPTIESFLYLRVSAEAHALLKGLQGSGLHVDNNGPRVTCELITAFMILLCSNLFIHAPRSSSSPPSFLDAPPSARRLCRGLPTLFSARFTPSCTRARSAQGLGCVLCLPLSRSLSPARMLRTPCLSPRPVPHQRPRRCIQIDANARAGLQTPNRGVEGGIDNLHACHRSRRGRGCCFKWS